MPQIGNQKFPYTPAGKKRYQQIKNKLGRDLVGRGPVTPSGGVSSKNSRPVNRPKSGIESGNGRTRMPFMPSKGYGRFPSRPGGKGNNAVMATRPGGSVRPVIQGGKGATLPSLKERRNGRRFL